MLSSTRRLPTVALAAGLALALAASPGAAQDMGPMTFEPSPNGEIIYARGQIYPDSAEGLKKLLDEDDRYRFGFPRDGVTLQLHSPGGAVVGGIELANLVRSRGLNTHVNMVSGCFSSCTFVFIGGLRRVMEGTFGIHAMSVSGGQSPVAYNDQHFDAVQQLTSTLINLTQTMIGDSRMVTAMLMVPAATMQMVGDDNLAEWRIITHAARPSQRMTASFDCTGDLDLVRRLICDHLTLAEADRRVAEAFAWLTEKNAAPDLAQEQERWVKHRDSCRIVPGPTEEFGPLSCISRAYDIRVKQLEGLKAFVEAGAEEPAAAGWSEHRPIQDLLMIKQ